MLRSEIRHLLAKIANNKQFKYSQLKNLLFFYHLIMENEIEHLLFRLSFFDNNEYRNNI